MKPSKKAQLRFRAQVRDLTQSRYRAMPVPVLVNRVNAYVRGWGVYFGAGHRGTVFNKMNQFVYGRMLRQLKGRSQRHLRPPAGCSYYRYIYERLGVHRL